MYQLNTTSNVHPTDATTTLMTSFSPMNLMQTEPNETSSNAKKQFAKSFAPHMTSTGATESQNMKRLTNILSLGGDATNLDMRGTLSETFNVTSFHSPTNAASQTKSIRQKISNMKPVAATRDDERTMKSPEYKKGFSPGLRESVSPQRDSASGFLKNTTESRKSKKNLHESPLKPHQQTKMKQINMIYRNNSVVEHLRQSRTNLNNSNIRGGSHSPANAHHNPANFFSSYIQGSGIGNTSVLSPNGSVLDNTHENLTGTGSKTTQPNGLRRFGSIGTPSALEKGMLLKPKRNSSTKHLSQGSFMFLEKTLLNKTYQRDNKLTQSTNPSSSTNTSFQSVTKEGNGFSKSGNFGIEKFATDTNNVQGEACSMMSSDIVSGNANASKGDLLLSKVEGLIANKSADPQHLEQIGSILDGFADVFCDNEKNKEGAKARGILRKIKLAYEVYFTNFSQNQNKKVFQAQDYQHRLEKDCQILESKLSEMGAEIEHLQKENERLLAQSKQQPKSSNSPNNSQSTVKQNHEEHQETPPGTKNNQNLQLSEFETVKSIISSQQQTINAMKKKEAKMVRLLYACKKRGLDIEQIYYEDVKSSHDESDIPTVNKSSGGYHSQGQYQVDHMQGDYFYPSHTTLNDEHEGEYQEGHSVAESDYHEKSSELNPYEDVRPINEKSITTLEPGLKNQLKLDFTVLNQAKQQKYQTQYVSYEQKPKIENVISKKQPLALDLNNIKSEDEKSVGFHEEFMSKMDEFSVSWRQAALKERKIP